MSQKLLDGQMLYRALVAEQFPMPANCCDVALELPVRGMLVLRYRVYVSGENAQKLGRALARCGAETLPTETP